MKPTNYLLSYILPVVVYCSIIFYFSSLSVIPGLPGTALINDKAKHAVLYLGLALLIYRAIVVTKYNEYAYVAAILFATLYCISDEIHQFFVPGRSMSIYDEFANAFGSSLILLNKLRMKRLKDRLIKKD